MHISDSFFLSLMNPRPTRSTLFPYTTLFRSEVGGGVVSWRKSGSGSLHGRYSLTAPAQISHTGALDSTSGKLASGCGRRSEEHTSELQSHVNLVCRLLLEKKKNKKCMYNYDV